MADSQRDSENESGELTMLEDIYMGHAMTERVGEFIQLRRDIHAHPELAFEEHRTAALVAGKLRDWGYEVTTGLGKTGVVGTCAVAKVPVPWGCVRTWMRCRFTKQAPVHGSAHRRA